MRSPCEAPSMLSFVRRGARTLDGSNLRHHDRSFAGFLATHGGGTG